MDKKGGAARLEKARTGIKGFDEISYGGLPKGRPTLVCGSPGCGKTLFGMEFLVRGALQFNEPGVFISFEESSRDLEKNVGSLGFDLKKLAAQKLIATDYIHIERSEIEETGEYDLEALFIRLAYAIDSIKAKRIVLDTIEALFSGLSNAGIIRAELRRLFKWLKEKGITAVITGESGEKTLTRYGLEEYVADCVILLDFRVREQIATRRLRIVKYRGSSHGVDEYPFLIDEDGISILPVTSLGLNYRVATQRISSGIARLDAMMDGKGFYRGSTILISGTAGTGKSSLAAKFCESACHRGERCLYFAFEESPDQIARNMKSIGIDLDSCVKKGTLRFHATRPSLHGLEMHLVTFHKLILEFKPQVVVIDPVSNLRTVGERTEIKSMLTRLFDFLKMSGVTTMVTDLAHAGAHIEQTEEEISSLIDTWILLKDVEIYGERNRALYILKSRGMPHSNQVREFLISRKGIDLIDVYLGPEGVLTGSARAAQIAKESTGAATYERELARNIRERERRKKVLEARMEEIRAELESESDELKFAAEEEKKRRERLAADRLEMARMRKADPQGGRSKK